MCCLLRGWWTIRKGLRLQSSRSPQCANTLWNHNHVKTSLNPVPPLSKPSSFLSQSPGRVLPQTTVKAGPSFSKVNKSACGSLHPLQGAVLQPLTHTTVVAGFPPAYAGHTLETGLSSADSIGSHHSKFGLSPSSNLERNRFAWNQKLICISILYLLIARNWWVCLWISTLGGFIFFPGEIINNCSPPQRRINLHCWSTCEMLFLDSVA